MKNSPVVAENRPDFKMKNSQGHIATSGFPFEDPVEDDAFGQDGFRSQLDNLAARHPQFAQQLRGAPWGGSWGRKRRGSGSLAENDTRDQQSGPSGQPQSPFQEEQARGFPFDDFPSDFRQHIPADFEFPREFQAYSTIPRKPRQREFNPRQEFATASASAHPQPTAVPERKDFSTQTEPPQDQRIQQPLQQAHTQTEPIEPPTEPLSQHGLRNTVDLGQKLSQLDDSIRNQRSMSAPPESRQRFVSRINIDPLQNQAMGGQYSSANKTNQTPAMAAQQNTPQAAQGGKGPTVRHIPIFVEGRDEPVLNKNINTPTGASNQPPIPEPTAFAQNVNKPQQGPGSIFRAAQGFAPNAQQHAAPSQQQYAPQQQQQQQQVPPPQPPMANDPISKIQMIQKDVLDLMSQVEVFVGTRKDKQYIYLDEMLTRNLLKLDDVETEGKDNIRQARKEAIRCIQKCIAVLEAKADGLADQFKPSEPVEQSNNAQTDNVKMEVDVPSNIEGDNLEKSPSQKMDVGNCKTEESSISKASSKSSVTSTAPPSDSKSSIANDVTVESNATETGTQTSDTETKSTHMEVEPQDIATESSH